MPNHFEAVAADLSARDFHSPTEKPIWNLISGSSRPSSSARLKKLEPHGLGNPLPTFAARNVRAAVQRAFGREKNHLQLILDNGLEGIFWRGKQLVPKEWQSTDPIDLIFQLDWNDYRGRPVLTIKDMGRINTLWS